jgi:acid phosphatase (class A)
MKLTRLHVFGGLLLLLLSACANGESYPYPPTYLTPAQVPATVLPAPTPRDSKALAAEVATILKLQKQVTPAQITRATAEIPVRPEMITDRVFGPRRFNRNIFPKTFALLDRVGSDNARITHAAKDYWDTKRPYLEHPRIQLLIKPPLNPAYPSGHTSGSLIFAETLGLALPRYANALRAQADEVALGRIRVGLHYPHDVEGGRLLATQEMALLRHSPKFQADLAAARKELGGVEWLKKRPVEEVDPIEVMPLPDRQSIMLQPL